MSRRTTLPTHGSTYFVLAVGTSFVKVGWTSSNPEKRLAALQTGCPHQLYLLAAIPSGAYFESRIHNELRDDHVRGEWFSLTTNTLKAILTSRDHTKKGNGRAAWIADPILALAVPIVECGCSVPEECSSLTTFVQDNAAVRLLEECRSSLREVGAVRA